LKYGLDGFADADGCVDLSGGDHIDVKRDGTDTGLPIDPIGSLEEFLCSSFVIEWGLYVSLGPGNVAEVWGVVVIPPAVTRWTWPWSAGGKHRWPAITRSVITISAVPHMPLPYRQLGRVGDLFDWPNRLRQRWVIAWHVVVDGRW
jgi:hypothetical protein